MVEIRFFYSMGEFYKDVVIVCLFFGGDEMEYSEDELGWEVVDDKDGISVGVYFIEEVLGKLVVIVL